MAEAEMDAEVSPVVNQQHKGGQETQKGICYVSRVPPYMKPNYIRKLLLQYSPERIFLLQQSEWIHKNRSRKGGNKNRRFTDGWVQFSDKRLAKLAALTLNGTKMVAKKGSFYSEDLWTLKYLPKFKWHHLTERLAHEERLKKERLKVELEQERRLETYYDDQLHKSKVINSIVTKKIKKGRPLAKSTHRNFSQSQLIDEPGDN